MTKCLVLRRGLGELRQLRIEAAVLAAKIAFDIRRRRPHGRAQRDGALEQKTDVVLSGEPYRAVQLDAGRGDGQRSCARLRYDTGSKRVALGRVSLALGDFVDQRPRRLDMNVAVDGLELERLERPDQPVELPACAEIVERDCVRHPRNAQKLRGDPHFECKLETRLQRLGSGATRDNERRP